MSITVNYPYTLHPTGKQPLDDRSTVQNTADLYTSFTTNCYEGMIVTVKSEQSAYILVNESQVGSSSGWKKIDSSGGGGGGSSICATELRRYARAASAPDVPEGSFTYDFATGILAGNTSPYGEAIPAVDANHNPCYYIYQYISTSPGSTTVAFTEWKGPVKIFEDTVGPEGPAGTNSATVELYQRAENSSKISKPDASVWYTFGTSKLDPSSVIGNWERTIPDSDSSHYPCFSIRAYVASTDSSVIIGPNDWSAISKILEDGTEGPEGPAGDTYEYVYGRTENGEGVPNDTSVNDSGTDPSGKKKTDDGYLPKFVFGYGETSRSVNTTSSQTGVDASYRYEYVSKRRKTNNNWSTFSTPALCANYVAAALDSSELENIKKSVQDAVSKDVAAANQRISDVSTRLYNTKEGYDASIQATDNKVSLIASFKEDGSAYTTASFAQTVIDASGIIDNWAGHRSKEGELTSVQSLLDAVEGVIGNYADYKDSEGNLSTVKTFLDAKASKLELAATKANVDASITSVRQDMDASNAVLMQSVSMSHYIIYTADDGSNYFTDSSGNYLYYHKTNDSSFYRIFSNIAKGTTRTDVSYYQDGAYKTECSSTLVTGQAKYDKDNNTFNAQVGILLTDGMSFIRQLPAEVDIAAISNKSAAQIVMKATDKGSYVVLDASNIYLHGTTDASQLIAKNIKTVSANITYGEIQNAKISDCSIESYIMSSNYTPNAHWWDGSGFMLDPIKGEFAIYGKDDKDGSSYMITSNGINIPAAIIRDRLTADKIDATGLSVTQAEITHTNIHDASIKECTIGGWIKSANYNNGSESLSDKKGFMFDTSKGEFAMYGKDTDGNITEFTSNGGISVPAARITGQLDASKINTYGIDVSYGFIGGLLIGNNAICSSNGNFSVDASGKITSKSGSIGSVGIDSSRLVIKNRNDKVVSTLDGDVSSGMDFVFCSGINSASDDSIKGVKMGKWSNSTAEYLYTIFDASVEGCFYVDCYDDGGDLESTYLYVNDTAYTIRAGCISCGACISKCPTEAIEYDDTEEDYPYVIDSTKCISCGACAKICPVGIIEKTSATKNICIYRENSEDAFFRFNGYYTYENIDSRKFAKTKIYNNGIINTVNISADNGYFGGTIESTGSLSNGYIENSQFKNGNIKSSGDYFISLNNLGGDENTFRLNNSVFKLVNDSSCAKNQIRRAYNNFYVDLIGVNDTFTNCYETANSIQKSIELARFEAISSKLSDTPDATITIPNIDINVSAYAPNKETVLYNNVGMYLRYSDSNGSSEDISLRDVSIFEERTYNGVNIVLHTKSPKYIINFDTLTISSSGWSSTYSGWNKNPSFSGMYMEGTWTLVLKYGIGIPTSNSIGNLGETSISTSYSDKIILNACLNPGFSIGSNGFCFEKYNTYLSAINDTSNQYKGRIILSTYDKGIMIGSNSAYDTFIAINLDGNGFKKLIVENNFLKLGDSVS